MGQFVKQHEQHVSGHEFRDLLTILRRKAFESRNAAERGRSRVDPGLEISGVGGSRLRESGLGGEREDDRRKQQDSASPVQPRFHESPRNAALSDDADPLDVIAGLDRQSGLPDCACCIARSVRATTAQAAK
jgi:hypothetical protein